MASNVTPPPASQSGEAPAISPELIAQLLDDLDGKPTVAKVRDALVALLHALS